MFKPGYNHVIVKTVDLSQQYESNIIVPDMDDKKPLTAEIIAVGPGDISATGQRIDMQFNVGDTIIFGNFSGVKFTYKGEEYICLKDREIFTVIED